ncbi:MAG: zincin-like metallopeptidase domain-containing protein [Geobacteraceae bacterium]|nr:zincin-like metallopeptidase domain-containing protein [Geobacteraceae bacterium]
MNVYEIINKRIIDLLERGTIPWKKPWNVANGIPVNLVSKKEYRGVNVFMLACQQYGSPYWMTFKQIKEKGGYVRQGEKATPVIFWKWLDRNDADDDPEGKNGKVPLLRYYNVFNLEQTEGIPIPEPEVINNPLNSIEKAEQIITGMPLKPDIYHGGNKACYSPSQDTIHLPNQHSFLSPEEYYCTAFHELIHSTGHTSRIGRKSILEPTYFGSHEYSKEELVAEMGAAFLCGYAGIEQNTLENSASYIQGWLKVLKKDMTLLVHASAQAQKGADYILKRKGGEEEVTDCMAA